ncbi:hypothetical protein M0R45_015695 [Rubus argutus]|uniref:Uncharacterized protein n=1 Tax=Rubus argutus TaxID=59490 RepID=A0AAW1XST5_RUBAR
MRVGLTADDLSTVMIGLIEMVAQMNGLGVVVVSTASRQAVAVMGVAERTGVRLVATFERGWSREEALQLQIGDGHRSGGELEWC